MDYLNNLELLPEENGINLKNEGSLHSSIKKWYALSGDRLEARVEGYIIDIVRGALLIEIQTRNFSSIRKKLSSLVKKHSLHLVYPIAKEKWIARISPEGEILSRRRSPKSGSIYNLFDELIRIPSLIDEDNFTVEVLIIKEEEVRCEDGKGSWRRKGVSIKDRRLVDVVEQVNFSSKWDFLKLLPDALAQPFSNKDLAKCVGISVTTSQKVTYCLKKMGVIKETGKYRNELLFETVQKVV